MRRRGSSDARRDTSQGEEVYSPTKHCGAYRREDDGSGDAGSGREAEPPSTATNSTRGAMRGFVSGRSRAEPTKMRRVAQDCDPKTYMYMSSGRKDARIGHFSWASAVARNKAARWKANQHSSSHEQPNSTRSVTKKVYQTFSQRLPFLLERRAASTKRIVRTPSCAPGKSCGLRSLTAAQNSR